jgi:hypothetical protein
MSGDAKKDRATNALFRRLMDRTDLHIRVPNQRFCDIEVLGTAAEMHGPRGVCTCCKRGAA